MALYPLTSSGVVSPGGGAKIAPLQKSSGMDSTLRYLLQQKRSRENTFAKALNQDVVTGLRNDLQKKQSDSYNTYRDKWTKVFQETNGRLSMEQKMQMQSEMTGLAAQQKTWISSQTNWENQMEKLVLDNEGKYNVERSLSPFDPNNPNKLYLRANPKDLGSIVNGYIGDFKATSKTGNKTISADGLSYTTASTTQKSDFDTPEEVEYHKRQLFRQGGGIEYTLGSLLEDESEEIQKKYTDEIGYANLEDYFVGEKRFDDFFNTKSQSVYTRPTTPKTDSRTWVQRDNILNDKGDPTGFYSFKLGTKAIPLNNYVNEVYAPDGKKIDKGVLFSNAKITEIKDVNIEGKMRRMAMVIYSADKKKDGKQVLEGATDTDRRLMAMQEGMAALTGANKEKKFVMIPYEKAGVAGFKGYEFEQWDPYGGRNPRKNKGTINETDDFVDEWMK